MKTYLWLNFIIAYTGIWIMDLIRFYCKLLYHYFNNCKPNVVDVPLKSDAPGHRKKTDAPTADDPSDDDDTQNTENTDLNSEKPAQQEKSKKASKADLEDNEEVSYTHPFTIQLTVVVFKY